MPPCVEKPIRFLGTKKTQYVNNLLEQAQIDSCKNPKGVYKTI